MTKKEIIEMAKDCVSCDGDCMCCNCSADTDASECLLAFAKFIADNENTPAFTEQMGGNM